MMLNIVLKFRKAFATMVEDEKSPFVTYFKEVEDEDGSDYCLPN